MDEFCNIDLPNSKKYLSVSRSRNIDIQCVVQSISQLADRYPRTEWQELVGDCDYQLFLGCNDIMTADFISSQCGNITVRVNNESSPMTPSFPSALNVPRSYTHGKTSTGRPLMMPDEVRRLPKNKAILFVRGAKPLLLEKIMPEELASFQKLKYCKATDHTPEWRKREAKPVNIVKPSPPPPFKNKIADEPEEYVPKEEELNLNGSFITLSPGIDCKTLEEIPPEDI